ncbi:hypothetical protein MD535_08140 [Vibrio sp. ZSDZ65]|uniref:Major coat protein n=1 Tax=Vibrio qingdaonensis TaxID=2829491 RepID=A0A9X3CMI5_9VIBR|nr:hypothetical protein [Vibrio qingdaonensis]MCW8345976.1 hypothetical protein [Vibrio qingdaonensis]
MKKQLLALATSAFVSVNAFAVDYTAEIGTAVSESQTNVTAVVLGVISVAAVGFGAGLLVKWLGR